MFLCITSNEIYNNLIFPLIITITTMFMTYFCNFLIDIIKKRQNMKKSLASC